MRRAAMVCAAVCAVAGSALPIAWAGGIVREPDAGARAVEPDPVAILKSTADVLMNAEALSFRARSFGTAAMATRSPTVEGRVTLARVPGSEPPAWRFVSTGDLVAPRSDDRRSFTVSFDGSSYRSLREAAKELHESPASARGTSAGPRLMNDGAIYLVRWLTDWNKNVAAKLLDDDQVRATYDGIANVGGELCHVIHVDYSSTGGVDEFGVWWYIDRETSLPRRVESFYSEGSDAGIVTVDITDFAINPVVDESAFVLALPEGFQRVAPETQAAGGGGGGRTARSAGPVEVGGEAPDFTLMDADGKPFKLSEARGSVVVMDFWATWCGPCKAAMPAVQALHERFKDRPVKVVGVNVWENGDPVEFKKKNGYTYGLLMKGDDVARQYGVRGIPAFFAVGVDGKVIFVQSGYVPGFDERLGTLIDAHLKAAGK